MEEGGDLDPAQEEKGESDVVVIKKRGLTLTIFERGWSDRCGGTKPSCKREKKYARKRHRRPKKKGGGFHEGGERRLFSLWRGGGERSLSVYFKGKYYIFLI